MAMADNRDRLLSSYDYPLSEQLIAQAPVVPRDSSRLLILDGKNQVHHQHFRDLGAWLHPGDLLVMNNTKVMPARLYGQKNTGAEVEVLLLEEQQLNLWLALVKPGKRFKLGTEFKFEGRQGKTINATVVGKDEATGGRLLQFNSKDGLNLKELLDDLGEMPLPPYINGRDSTPDQYQTVYAKHLGAIAAPTAGLHFTPELLQALTAQGIGQAFVTLHVGVGTFRPVEVETITDHGMHSEWIDVPETTIAKIKETKAQGNRVIAVGTTAVRSLEGTAQKMAGGELQAYTGKTDLFIYPGYQWQIIDAMITNFHLPKSSLLMLVSALIGREKLLALYRDAIDRNYRFYSFGDAMLLFPPQGSST